MKRFVLGLSFLLVAVPVHARFPPADRQLPKLHVIQTATLSPSYSCRDRAEFARGYEQTALFLSGYSRQGNAPNLLFNGACGSEDHFKASTAGDDMALIADLGNDVALESLTAHRVFNLSGVAGPDRETRFSASAPVVAGHTYAVLLNKSDVRGLFVLTVTTHVPNRSVTVRYAVQSYAIQRSEERAPGFGWDAGNAELPK
jgi:hypothetical protein